jgi:hypothetical protein
VRKRAFEGVPASDPLAKAGYLAQEVCRLTTILVEKGYKDDAIQTAKGNARTRAKRIRDQRIATDSQRANDARDRPGKRSG